MQPSHEEFLVLVEQQVRVIEDLTARITKQDERIAGMLRVPLVASLVELH